MSKKIITIIVIIIALGAGFEGGLLFHSHNKGTTKVGKHHHALTTKGATTSGTVLDNSGSTLTIKLTNGNTETIYTSSSTSYSQISTINSSNITNGATIHVIGIKNSNGSMTAKKIVLQ